jgi:hypothetical protein
MATADNVAVKWPLTMQGEDVGYSPGPIGLERARQPPNGAKAMSKGWPADLPDGQISSCFARMPVQPHLQKYSVSRLTQIRCISITVSFRQEGRSRVVTSAGRDAVDARASGAQWQSQGEMNLVSGQPACKMIGALADGEAVWFWHPLLVLNSRRLSRPDRAQTKP